MSELPKGWVKVTYDDVATYTDYVANGSFAALKENVIQSHDEDYAILVRLKDETKKWHGAFKYITEESYKFLSKSSLIPGDLFLANVGAPGRTFLVPDLKKPMTIAPNGIRVRAKGASNNRYLNYYIKSPIGQEGLKEITGGNAQQKFNKTHLKKSSVLLAPLNEQIRIVDKLDLILAKVDQAQACLEKIPSILKRFRQSVLTAATSGELTSEWREDNCIVEPWSTVKLLDVVISKPRNGKSPRGVDYDTGIRNLTLSATTLGYFVEDKYKFVDLDVSPDSHLWLKNDDILIQRANSIEYVGVSAIYKGKDDRYIYPDLIMKCRANEKILPNFLYFCLSSELVRRYFRANATGTTGNMPKINQSVVSNAPINFPTLYEQQEVVRRVELLLAKAVLIEKQYLTAKKRFDRLTPSILAKAFRGELVEQDPNDEPASLLLERIKQQLDAPKPAKKPRNPSKKVNQEIKVTVAVVEPSQLGSEVLSILQKTSDELSAQQIMDQLTEQTFEQVDVLFTELKRLLDAHAITKAGIGERCTFKVTKK
ncbi:restriction endonuclease subunit S [Shewanella sp. 0m-4]